MGKKKGMTFDYKDVETLSKYISPTGPREVMMLRAPEAEALDGGAAPI
jgi:ribosomal protein S18